MSVSGAEIVVLLVAVAAGALVQGSIGFGLSLTAVPVFGLLEPSALPATIILIAFPMTVWMSIRERADIDVRGFIEIMIGRLPGTALAIWVLSLVSTREISAVVGIVVVVAAIISVLAPEFEMGMRLRVAAGTTSGFMGTIAGIGGPPLALVYQRRSGPELRSTLALTFLVGGTISLVALAVSGHVQTRHLLLATSMIPGLAAGLFLAARFHRTLERGWLRPAVIAFAIISGVVAIARGLGLF